MNFNGYKFLLIFLSSILFFSCREQPVPPTVTTKDVTEITAFSAVSGGNITSDGGSIITDQGICWNIYSPPTIENSKTSSQANNPFSASLTGLLPNTVYYVRAFAENVAGISYGDAVQFRTPGGLPGIVNDDVSGITMNSAVMSTDINPNCLPTVVTLEYGETRGYGDKLTITDVPLTGNYAVTIKKTLTGLNQLTVYHYRYIATNQLGTTESPDMTFSTYGMVSDADGNSYKTVLIDNQIWMAENLRTTSFPDGDPILNGEDIDNIFDGKAYYFRYKKDSNLTAVHGLLYNYYAATRSIQLEPDYSNSVPGEIQGACPTGWHLPSFPEFQIMVDYLGGEAVAGGKLKSTELWKFPNQGATNSSKFSALPSGAYDKENFGYNYMGVTTGFWSSTGRYSYFSILYLEYSKEEAPMNYANSIFNGASIRCVKN
jgi:uncharacterized protein (TIGR02145 family)